MDIPLLSRQRLDYAGERQWASFESADPALKPRWACLRGPYPCPWEPGGTSSRHWSSNQKWDGMGWADGTICQNFIQKSIRGYGGALISKSTKSL